MLSHDLSGIEILPSLTSCVPGPRYHLAGIMKTDRKNGGAFVVLTLSVYPSMEQVVWNLELEPGAWRSFRELLSLRAPDAPKPKHTTRPRSHAHCAVCNNRKTYRRQMRNRWIAAGLCPKCGGERGRFKMCLKCRERDSYLKKERYRVKGDGHNETNYSR